VLLLVMLLSLLWLRLWLLLLVLLVPAQGLWSTCALQESKLQGCQLLHLCPPP
jgi:hypothetical protein